MFTGKLLKQIVDKFTTSPAAQEARVQVVLPNGDFYDIDGVKLYGPWLSKVSDKVGHSLQ